jgi:hypothetical protein
MIKGCLASFFCVDRLLIVLRTHRPIIFLRWVMRRFLEKGISTFRVLANSYYLIPFALSLIHSQFSFLFSYTRKLVNEKKTWKDVTS